MSALTPEQKKRTDSDGRSQDEEEEESKDLRI
jgi:hypothetical protein